MDLHVRRMVWTPSGWPVVSPERHAAVPQDTINASKLIGKWEHIDLEYSMIQNVSKAIEFLTDSIISCISNSKWFYMDRVLNVSINSGQMLYQARVFSEQYWENKRKTIVYSGLSSTGKAIWGKKVN